MKKIVLAALVLLMSTSFLMAQVKDKDQGKQTQVPEARFNELKHHFGDIAQGKPVTTSFTFVNEGKAPLVIEVATASCGCTTPTYPKAPVLPGKKGAIDVTFNAEAPNSFSKMVTVKFAGHDKPVLLVIDGNVKTK